SSRFIPVSLITVALFFFISCNGNEEKTDTNTMSDSTVATTTPEPAAPSTIITTEQAMMVVKHKVSNFEKWKASYDAHDSMRLAMGVHNYVIGRGLEDSNMVLVAVKADDMAKAKAFSMDPSLKQAMQKGGVIGKPDAEMITMTYQDNAVINSQVRSETVFSVKDWNAWVKAFEQGKQERMDNGIVERAYGHDADDNNKVRLVTAIMDSSKAAAYWKSDMLKARRTASGVTSEPKRFLFRIVQRY
ncbi:MAG: hypothetical protein ABIY51_09155, partial [Ferruginibacter sp.]